MRGVGRYKANASASRAHVANTRAKIFHAHPVGYHPFLKKTRLSDPTSFERGPPTQQSGAICAEQVVGFKLLSP